MVDQAVNSTRDRRLQKAGYGSGSILWDPMVDVGIRSRVGHPPGSPHTTMPLQAKVYAAG